MRRFAWTSSSMPVFRIGTRYEQVVEPESYVTPSSPT